MTDPSLPRGTVTLLFTDIEGSTRLLEELGTAYADLIRDHHRIVGGAAEAESGSRVDAAGDGLFYSFPTAGGAVAAAVAAQHALADHTWPAEVSVGVRMGIHTGEPMSAETGYVGIDVHRAARICSAGHGGQILVSDATRALLGRGLPDGASLRDLGEHRLRGLAAPERIHQVIGDGLRADFPPVRSLDTLPNNLPRQLSSFVGRLSEIEEAEARLHDATTLTLTGPGGVGKTRLALEIGAHLVHDYEGGVWIIELAPVSEDDLVTDAIAAAIGVRQRPGTDLRESVVEAVAARPTLLILDNCEHILDAVVSTAADLLRRCPNLQLLATSREALGLPGESLMPVPSLSLPVQDDDLPALEQCDAVRLFVDRAQAVMPSFTLGPDNIGPVAQICRRLDGIPLAVELAAARIRSLPPQQIAARLDDRFRLLTGGTRTSLPRHRTLRAAFDWSYELLSTAEQALVPRLAVFAGSFSLAAAEAVCADGPVTAADMLDLLGRLIDRSLLQAEAEESEPRFRMLETIHDYAQERLADSGEGAEVHRRHRDWFVALVEQARPAFFSGPVQPVGVARLARDEDNLRAALRWADGDPDGATAELTLASGLWRFWELRGELAEGSAWLTRALARVGGEVSLRRASALTGAGVLAARRGDYEGAAAYHDASLLLHREIGDPLSIAAACSNSANMAVERGDLDRAHELFLEAIQLARQAGDGYGAAYSLINLADVAIRRGNADEAERLYAESTRAFVELGDDFGIAHATEKLAQAARRRGDRDEARVRYREAMAIHVRTGDRRAEGRLSASLGDLAAEDGDTAEAERLYRHGLVIRGELGDRVGVANALERLAGVAEDRPERAVFLLSAAEAIRDAVGVPLSAANAARARQFLDDLATRIGSDAVRVATAAGRAAPWPAVLARAEASD